MQKILALLTPLIKPLLILLIVLAVLTYVQHLNKKIAQLEVAAKTWENRLESLDGALSAQAKALNDIQAVTTKFSDRLRKLQLPRLIEENPKHAAKMANSIFADTQCLLERASGAKQNCDIAGTDASKTRKN